MRLNHFLSFPNASRRGRRPSPRAPLYRWSKLRATVVTGVAGAGVFSAATVLQGAFLMVVGSFPPPGIGLLEALPIVLGQGSSTGFLIGIVFAVLLAALYARVAVERDDPHGGSPLPPGEEARGLSHREFRADVSVEVAGAGCQRS